jgi:hypothetical protein
MRVFVLVNSYGVVSILNTFHFHRVFPPGGSFDTPSLLSRRATRNTVRSHIPCNNYEIPAFARDACGKTPDQRANTPGI